MISREMANLDHLEADLTKASQAPAGEKSAAYKAIIASYRKSVDGRRLIDAHIDYNWLWQRQIANNRALFIVRHAAGRHGGSARQTCIDSI